VIPSATGSIVTGAMLAIARVAGETAPLLFTALGQPLLTADLNQPFPSLTREIYEYAQAPTAAAGAGVGGHPGADLADLVLNLAIRFFTRQRGARGAV
jgi:phosphate transport system permease protein